MVSSELPTPHTGPVAPRRQPGRKIWLAAFGGLCCSATGIVWFTMNTPLSRSEVIGDAEAGLHRSAPGNWRDPEQGAEPTSLQSTDQQAADVPATSGENTRKLGRTEVEAALVGRWVSSYHGRMLIDKRADHTAELIIDFNFLAGLVYGSRVVMQLEWQYDGDQLVHTIKSGKPAASVDRIIRRYGRQCVYRIDSLTSDRIQMHEVADPGEVHVWTPAP